MKSVLKEKYYVLYEEKVMKSVWEEKYDVFHEENL